MVQFWQTNLDEAMIGPQPLLFRFLIPLLTVTLLVVNIFKEIFQIINEGKEYFIDKEYSINFENLGDLIVYVLVSICQLYYFGTGKLVKGYFFPDDGSYFENFLLLTILALHLNLIM